MNFREAMQNCGNAQVAGLGKHLGDGMIRRVERRTIRQMKKEGMDVSKIDWANVDWEKVLKIVLMVLAALGVL